MEQHMELTPRRSGPRHLQLRELVLVLLFPLIAPYWIAAMIGRRRWRAICESVGAVIAGFIGLILFILVSAPLEALLANEDLYVLTIMVGMLSAYFGAGYVSWLIALRPVPAWLTRRSFPGLFRRWGAGLAATLAVAAAVVWHTGRPEVLAYPLYVLYSMYYPMDLNENFFYIFAVDIPIEATFNMAGQHAWLATLIWLTVTAGLAMTTIHTYRVEEKRQLLAD